MHKCRQVVECTKGVCGCVFLNLSLSLSLSVCHVITEFYIRCQTCNLNKTTIEPPELRTELTQVQTPVICVRLIAITYINKFTNIRSQIQIKQIKLTIDHLLLMLNCSNQFTD